jgi:hypothetical protein
MWPVSDVPPTLSVGASVMGVLKDVLISILVSLTVGNRWRKPPASHAALAGAETDAAWANKSAGTANESAVAAELRRNPRRSLTGMGSLPCVVSPNNRHSSQRVPSQNFNA